MKKNILIFFILILPFILIASEVEKNFDINEIPENIQYCRIVGTSFELNTPPIISVDFGQKWIAKKYIKKDGEKILFNSIIETLNFMYENGWEYESSHIEKRGFGYIHNYILKRIKK